MNDIAPDKGNSAFSQPNRLRAAVEAVRTPQDFESDDPPTRPDLQEFTASARRLADLAEIAQTWAQTWIKEAFRLAHLAGWSAFGTHIDQPAIQLEFDGCDEDGMPLWERPKSQNPAGYAPCPHIGPATGEPCVMPARHDNGIHDDEGTPASRPLASLRRRGQNGGGQ